ncbi:MAG TPA: DegT/DnrJ/EryC1/StrS family aminotransferase [Vicinamibacterales bacterium]|jgi:dTDP-4-amino-4,6-dideoxygalactose transaminase
MTTGNRPSSVAFVDLVAQHSSIDAELTAATARVLRDAEFILGRDVGDFEGAFAKYCGCQHAVGVDSGTSALELALRAYGIGPGDEVILPANTFIATALAVSCAGATPVLADIDPLTYTLDVSRVADAITPRTRAVLPVHLYGQPADMDPILDLAREHALVVIEDACQAHGAEYKGRRVGSLGHAAAFSFYPSKNLGACGDGGIVVTRDPDVARSLQMLRNYGQERKYHHLTIGFNRRLDNLQAALLTIKLKHLDAWNDARRRRAERYSSLLGDAVVVPRVAAYANPVWHLYVIQSDDRDRLQACLNERGIATGIHYPIPIHLQPAYSGLGYRKGDFPITEGIADRILSLPMYPELPVDAVEEVARAVRAFVAGHVKVA